MIKPMAEVPRTTRSAVGMSPWCALATTMGKMAAGIAAWMTSTDFRATSSGAKRVNVMISGESEDANGDGCRDRPPAVTHGLPIHIVGDQRATEKQPERNCADR